MMMNRLRKTRITVAVVAAIIITLLFLDFTGSLHQWLGWIAKIQLLPALLALNASVVIGVVLLTLLFGRVYCSVICPLGTLQDAAAHTNRKKNRYRYSPAMTWLRYGVLALLIGAFFAEIGSLVALFEPYSTYGRIISNLFTPLYQWGNNLLAYMAERMDSYAFYSTEVWVKSIGTLITAAASLIIIYILAWRGGRTICNTVCPVGTLLGAMANLSLFKHRINTDTCNSCGLCARQCKASCIDPTTHSIDYTRCVSCFNCIDSCHKKAITYCHSSKKNAHNEPLSTKNKKQVADPSRRAMIGMIGALAAASATKAQEKKVDGGLAFIEDKRVPARLTPIVPPGARSQRNFSKRCTGCQLCVSVCPNGVLSPSTGVTTFMQPQMSFERGYCRPECVKCSEVCPAGAIEQINTAEKSATQVGHAEWIDKNCVVITDGVLCGNCARHCPTGAITMILRDPHMPDAGEIPAINTERCIGCGACENLCPARPFSAIYVEGHIMHRTI